MPRRSDSGMLHSALMGTILAMFPHRDLPLLGMCRHNPCDGVLHVAKYKSEAFVKNTSPQCCRQESERINLSS